MSKPTASRVFVEVGGPQIAIRVTVTRIEKTGAVTGVKESFVAEHWMAETKGLFISDQSHNGGGKITMAVAAPFVLAEATRSSR